MSYIGVGEGQTEMYHLLRGPAREAPAGLDITTHPCCQKLNSARGRLAFLLREVREAGPAGRVTWPWPFAGVSLETMKASEEDRKSPAMLPLGDHD